jgi:quercetin dioxygenase-like cupin family protein
MKVQSLILAACLALAAPSAARDPGEAVAPKFERAIPNIPGKSLIAAEVTFPPGPASLPHHHANSASIYAYVLSGSIRSQVEGEPARVYRAGESFYEAPGAHHLETLNVSSTEPAKLLAVFVVDTNDKQLTIFDK